VVDLGGTYGDYYWNMPFVLCPLRNRNLSDTTSTGQQLEVWGCHRRHAAKRTASARKPFPA
jgi:hypothetical protein